MTEKPPHRVDQLFTAIQDQSSDNSDISPQQSRPRDNHVQRFTPAYWRKKSENLSPHEKKILKRLTNALHIVIAFLGVAITALLIYFAVIGKGAGLWFMIFVFWLVAIVGLLALKTLGMFLILGITVYMARN